MYLQKKKGGGGWRRGGEEQLYKMFNKLFLSKEGIGTNTELSRVFSSTKNK